jgi:hypothetical protein
VYSIATGGSEYADVTGGYLGSVNDQARLQLAWLPAWLEQFGIGQRRPPSSPCPAAPPHVPAPQRAVWHHPD